MEGHLLEAEVIRLLHVALLARPLRGVLLRPRPVDPHDVVAFEHKHRVTLPAELRRWLRRCDGAPVNPGGLYSLFSRTPEGVSIDWHLCEYPAWRERGWFPIGGDGCGSVYVLGAQMRAPSGTHPVFFLDHSDPEQPSYLMASGLWRFLYRLLRSEIEPRPRGYWPHDRAAMQLEDPELAVCRGVGVRLPWEERRC